MLRRSGFLHVIIGLSLAVVLMPMYSHAVDTEGLVLYYTFDTEDDESITDLSGNGNNAKIEGNPKWVAGKLGQALDFKVDAPLEGAKTV